MKIFFALSTKNIDTKNLTKKILYPRVSNKKGGVLFSKIFWTHRLFGTPRLFGTQEYPIKTKWKSFTRSRFAKINIFLNYGNVTPTGEPWILQITITFKKCFRLLLLLSVNDVRVMVPWLHQMWKFVKLDQSGLRIFTFDIIWVKPWQRPCCYSYWLIYLRKGLLNEIGKVFRMWTVAISFKLLRELFPEILIVHFLM
jgi:hypothetical protein